MFIDRRKYYKFSLNVPKHKLFQELKRKRRRWNKESKKEDISKQIYFRREEIFLFKLYLRETHLCISKTTCPRPLNTIPSI